MNIATTTESCPAASASPASLWDAWIQAGRLLGDEQARWGHAAIRREPRERLAPMESAVRDARAAFEATGPLAWAVVSSGGVPVACPYRAAEAGLRADDVNAWVMSWWGDMASHARAEADVMAAYGRAAALKAALRVES